MRTMTEAERRHKADVAKLDAELDREVEAERRMRLEDEQPGLANSCWRRLVSGTKKAPRELAHNYQEFSLGGGLTADILSAAATFWKARMLSEAFPERN